MKCKKCNSDKIKIIEKNSGEKIYHCQNCGYNFTKAEITKKEPEWVPDYPSYPDFQQRKHTAAFVQKIGDIIDPHQKRPLLTLLLSLFGSLIAFFTLGISFNYIVTSTLYGYLIFVILGVLLLLTIPGFYLYILWNLITKKQGWFNSTNSFIWRFFYAILTIFFGLIALIAVFVCFFLGNMAVQDIIHGSEEKCLAFVRVSDEEANAGSNQYKPSTNDGNYIIFKTEQGDELKLKDLRLDYRKTKTGTNVCFQYFKYTNQYTLDRVK